MWNLSAGRTIALVLSCGVPNLSHSKVCRKLVGRGGSWTVRLGLEALLWGYVGVSAQQAHIISCCDGVRIQDALQDCANVAQFENAYFLWFSGMLVGDVQPASRAFVRRDAKLGSFSGDYRLHTRLS